MSNRHFAIAVNGSMLDEHPTGVGVYSYNLINKLSQLYRGEKVTEMTVFTPTIANLSAPLNIVKLSSLLLSSRYGKLAAISRFLWNTFWYAFQARDFDLLISLTTHGTFLKRNQIITIHDLLSLRFENISAHQRFYFKYLLPSLLSRARSVIAVSETTKNDIVKFFHYPAEKVEVIHNAYDAGLYHEHAESVGEILRAYGFRDYFLAVGPTYRHKNFEVLLDAYGRMDPAFRAIHPMLIAGGKPRYVKHLKAYIKKTGLGSDVHFLGYVPLERMPALYRDALALVFPSLYEGFGIPLLEAMACGCPVIVSNTSSMPEVCGEAAYYFDPVDREALFQGMTKILMDHDLRSALKRKGLEQAKKFSWQQSAEKLKSLIDNQI